MRETVDTLRQLTLRCSFASQRRSGGMADAGDSKSPAPCGRVGSTPTSGTNQINHLQAVPAFPLLLARGALYRSCTTSARRARACRRFGASGEGWTGGLPRPNPRDGETNFSNNFNFLADAKAWAAKTELELRSRHALGGRRTVADAIDHYRAHQLGTLSPTHIDQRERHVTWWQDWVGRSFSKILARAMSASTCGN